MKFVRRRSRLSRLLILFFLIALLGFFFADQQNHISVESYTVSSNRLPASFDGFTIVHISDLHGKLFGKNSDALLRQVAAQEPDLIALTGDLIDASEEFAMLPALCEGLSDIAPTYYVTGNHEWAIREVNHLTTLLTSCKVTPLSNSYVVLEREGEHIVLAGIHDPQGPLDQKSLSTLTAEIRKELGDPYILLLAHRNTNFPEYAANAVDLTLSGHGHGGLIRLPFTDGLISTDRTLFPTWTAGLYTMDPSQMLVSRGLGNNSYTFRLFNRPHLPVITLRYAN